ncbi:hypothetical protein SAMN05443661_13123 [Natronobacterium gregoryi]|uniref:Uncharacterized protein n=1 Tax=Natronobacterium gregoryi TaxID=44930 RepID=A0A1I3ND21_9EURY|nr:hypothetical protein [Natronobacterium gregoryi]SFJ07213.1 hypothetical protein SAMN05443661_11349 [Natronobacterium gregoryi]SFJ46074.1 hypothetical protein SAMN05443661_13123 [Natronobacterium gregoryi]
MSDATTSTNPRDSSYEQYVLSEDYEFRASGLLNGESYQPIAGD